MNTILTPLGQYLQSHIDQVRRSLRRTFVIGPRDWWERKTNEWIVALFIRAIKMKEVQVEIAYQLGGTGPLCRVFKNAIDDAIKNIVVDVDDIRGLDNHIEDALENIEIDSSTVIGLEDYIKEVVEDVEIEADHVTGLDDMIGDAIAEKLNAIGDEAQEVEEAKQNDLEAEVRNLIMAALEDIQIAEEVAKKVGQMLADKLTA